MLNELLHKYLYKQPSKDDARSIKRWIDTASEPEIEQALLQEWEKNIRYLNPVIGKPIMP